MSKQRLVKRQGTHGLSTRWHKTGFLKEHEIIDGVDTGQLLLADIPTGRKVDDVRLYAYHDLYGTVDFDNESDFDFLYLDRVTNIKDDYFINYDEYYLHSLAEVGINLYYKWYIPDDDGDAIYIDQPRDNTPIELWCPFFKEESNLAANYYLNVHFNNNDIGGTWYARFEVYPHVGDDDYIDVKLTAYQAGVAQAGASSGSTLRLYGGEEVAYRFRFRIDEVEDKYYVDIYGDYSGSAEFTLEVTPPAGVDTQTNSYFSIIGIRASEIVTKNRTAIKHLKYLKETSEADRITYKLSRDGGTTWASVSGDDIVETGYGYDDVDLSGQGAGSGVINIKATDIYYPAIIKGVGLAWEDDQ